MRVTCITIVVLYSYDFRGNVTEFYSAPREWSPCYKVLSLSHVLGLICCTTTAMSLVRAVKLIMILAVTVGGMSNILPWACFFVSLKHVHTHLQSRHIVLFQLTVFVNVNPICLECFNHCLLRIRNAAWSETTTTQAVSNNVLETCVAWWQEVTGLNLGLPGNDTGQVVHTRNSVTKQCNLVAV